MRTEEPVTRISRPLHANGLRLDKLDEYLFCCDSLNTCGTTVASPPSSVNTCRDSAAIVG